MFEFQGMNLGLVEATKTEWYKQLDEIADFVDISSSGYERIIDWAFKHANGTSCEGDCLTLYGLVKDEDSYACAILEVTDARRSKDPALKLLSIYLQPIFNIEYRDKLSANESSDIVKAISFSLAESAKLAFVDSGLKKLKVFGRTEEMRGFFDAIIARYADHDIEGVDVAREGKWLVFARM